MSSVVCYIWTKNAKSDTLGDSLPDICSNLVLASCTEQSGQWVYMIVFYSAKQSSSDGNIKGILSPEAPFACIVENISA